VTQKSEPVAGVEPLNIAGGDAPVLLIRGSNDSKVPLAVKVIPTVENRLQPETRGQDRRASGGPLVVIWNLTRTGTPPARATVVAMKTADRLLSFRARQPGRHRWRNGRQRRAACRLAEPEGLPDRDNCQIANDIND